MRALNPVKTFVGSQNQRFVGRSNRGLCAAWKFVDREFAILVFCWREHVRLAVFIEHVDAVVCVQQRRRKVSTKSLLPMLFAGLGV